MNIIEKLKKRLTMLPKKTIILPEAMDERVLQAALKLLKEDIVNIILLGDKNQIIANHPLLKKCEIINPKESELLDKYINDLCELRKSKNLDQETAKSLLLNNYMYFACMLVLDKKADGIVSGACHSSSDTLRPALQLIKSKKANDCVSAFFLMDIPNFEYSDGLYVFSDCGLNQNPNSNELASIAIKSANSYRELVGQEPIVAMLSHSTYGSSKHSDVTKVQEATKLLKEEIEEFLIDGELQLDSAIIPEVASIKAPESSVAGRANVLIFPDLDSGNIGYKLVERFAHAKAYGPLTQGLKYPVNDLSRGCSVEDIIGVIIITAIQAQKN